MGQHCQHKVIPIEFAANFKSILDAWKVKRYIWFRECVYKRVTPRGKKPGFTSMITFFTSEFWICAIFFLVTLFQVYFELIIFYLF